jgi:hypothetical protein
VGTGSALITEKLFKGKVEKQQQAIKDAIRLDVPRVIDHAMSVSEQRLHETYAKVVKEAETQEELWLKTQKEAVEAAQDTEQAGKAQELEGIMNTLQAFISKLNND